MNLKPGTADLDADLVMVFPLHETKEPDVFSMTPCEMSVMVHLSTRALLESLAMSPTPSICFISHSVILILDLFEHATPDPLVRATVHYARIKGGTRLRYAAPLSTHSERRYDLPEQARVMPPCPK